MKLGGGALAASRSNIERARELRRSMTLPEVQLWQALRARPDGQVHEDDKIARIDQLRQADLESHGYAVLRIAARDVLDKLDGVVRMFVAECWARAPLHQPSAGPPPRIGEDLR